MSMITLEVQQRRDSSEDVEVVASIAALGCEFSSQSPVNKYERVGPEATKDKSLMNSSQPFHEARTAATGLKMVDILAQSDVDENQNVLNQRKVGCKCKKSTCLVKFCECVQNHTKCRSSCKCFNCGYDY